MILSLPSLLSALVGGALIGASASILLLGAGRIAGISGIVGGLLRPKRGDVGWRMAFVGGLLLGAIVLGRVAPSVVVATSPVSVGLVIVAGLLVGVGTQLGNGCTSGHGVCGMSRLSRRSIVATLVFMTTGALATFATRALAGGGS